MPRIRDPVQSQRADRSIDAEPEHQDDPEDREDIQIQLRKDRVHQDSGAAVAPVTRHWFRKPIPIYVCLPCRADVGVFDRHPLRSRAEGQGATDEAAR